MPSRALSTKFPVHRGRTGDRPSTPVPYNVGGRPSPWNVSNDVSNGTRFSRTGTYPYRQNLQVSGLVRTPMNPQLLAGSQEVRGFESHRLHSKPQASDGANAFGCRQTGAAGTVWSHRVGSEYCCDTLRGVPCEIARHVAVDIGRHRERRVSQVLGHHLHGHAGHQGHGGG